MLTDGRNVHFSAYSPESLEYNGMQAILCAVVLANHTGGNLMTDRNRDQSMFHDDLYKKAIAEIGTLKKKLPEDAFASLAREVIRRLSDHPSVTTSSIAFPTDSTIEELARALLEPDVDVGIRFIKRVRDQGASVETVYLAYLAEAAKILGEWWEKDEISFTDVTVATGHIYAVMRGLNASFLPEDVPRAQPEAFFCGVPGETHLLGVSMAADLFRKEGWDIALKRGLDHDEIIQLATQTNPVLIGLSAAGEHAVVPLAQLIIALRICVPKTAIMVSGAILETAYEDVLALGPDIIPTGMDDALERAQHAWAQTQNRSQFG